MRIPQEHLQKMREVLKQVPVEVTDEKCEQLYRFYSMLIETNKVMNLTAITEYQDVLEKHFLDSLMLAMVLDPSGKTVIDVGTGAGFPGIPLKIFFPDTEITLLDSLNKRVGFLEQVIWECGLSRICAVHGRAEDLAKKGAKLRENSDICVSRAVANLSSLSEYCLPFVKPGGVFVAYKTDQAEEEQRKAGPAIRLLGGKVEKTVSFRLPGTEIGRSLILIRKVKKTPPQYPRKAGMPGKQPL